MKKLLILALTAVASLGLTFGATLAFSAAGGGDEVNSLSDLVGKSFTLNAVDVGGEQGFTINIAFNSADNDYSSITYIIEDEVGHLYYDETLTGNGNSGDWVGEDYATLNVYTSQTISGTGDVSAFLTWITTQNGGLSEYDVPAPAEPEETPTIWQAILSGIGGFLSGMFGLLTGLFSGVGAVFYTNNTTTIVLQALIFAAAAGLVAAAVYVIVRLIKSAVARLRGGVSAAEAKHLARERKKVKKHFKELRKYNASKERCTRKYIKRHYKK